MSLTVLEHLSMLVTENKEFENVFFLRFITIFYWWLLPCISLFILFNNILFFKESLYLKNKLFNLFYPHKNFFHNVFFLIVIGVLIVNAALLLYFLFDIFLLSNWYKYSYNWTFYSKTGGTGGDLSHDDKEQNVNKALWYFLSIIFFGFIFHLVNACVYIWYNINKTNSFFSTKPTLTECYLIVKKSFYKYIYWDFIVKIKFFLKKLIKKSKEY